MKQDRAEKKEIRTVLLGRTVLSEDGRLATPEPGAFYIPKGVTDGAGAVRFFGIKGKTRRYETDIEEQALMEAADQYMRRVGHELLLREQPDAAAALIRYLLTKPVVLTFRYGEGRPVLIAWCGRGLMSWISRLRAVRGFERAFSEALRPTDSKPEEKRRRQRRGGPSEEPEAPGEPGEAQPPEGTGFAPEYPEEGAPEYGEYPEEYWEEQPPEGSEYPDGYDGYGEYGEYGEEEPYEDMAEEPRPTDEEDGEP